MAFFFGKAHKVTDQLIISVKEARKLLGKDGKDLTDNQMIELIEALTSMSSHFLQDLGSINYNGSTQ